MEQHAARTQKLEPFGIAALVAGAVRALNPTTHCPDDQSKRRHAAAADAAEKVISKSRHGRKRTPRFQSSIVLFKHDFFPKTGPPFFGIMLQMRRQCGGERSEEAANR
jgi:hypothetical protein